MAKGVKRTQDRSVSTSLLKGLDVVSLLAAYPKGLRTIEITEKMGWPRSNVVRILQSLEDYGFVAYSNRKCALTELFYSWSQRDRYGRFRQQYRGLLTALSEKVRELVLLGVREGCGIVHIDCIEWDHAIRVAPAPLTVHGFLESAIGKLVLGREGRIEDWPEGREDEYQKIKREGIAWNREESVPGVIAVAAYGYSMGKGEPLLAVAWPTSRFTEEKGRDAIRWIKELRESIVPSVGAGAEGLG